jgi:RimJ/RimL family protein N-acetyltransferase
MEPVYLRALDVNDLDCSYQWRNDRKSRGTMRNPFRYISHGAEEAWLSEKQIASPVEVNLAICLKANSQHIGNIHLTSIDWVARRGEVQLLAGASIERVFEYQLAAIRLLTEYALKTLGLNRLYAYIVVDDTESIRMFEACGWTVEVRMREHAFRDGRFKDVAIVGLCAGDLARETG